MDYVRVEYMYNIGLLLLQKYCCSHWMLNKTEALGKKEREKKEMATKFNTLFRSKDT